jgi:hypothetical protein
MPATFVLPMFHVYLTASRSFSLLEGRKGDAVFEAARRSGSFALTSGGCSPVPLLVFREMRLLQVAI